MTPNLTTELSAAIDASGTGSVEAVHPGTNRTYVIVDGDTHHRAMEALRRQQDHDAIATGIAQMEAGEGSPLDEAVERVRSRLQLPQQS